MINDRLMAVGDWSIDLLPDTPQHIRNEFKAVGYADYFSSFVCFLENDAIGYDGTGVSDTVKDEFAETVVYTGPVWRRADKLRSFGGPSLIGMMGNARGSAFYSGAGASYPTTYPATISQIVASWFNATAGRSNGLYAGTSHSPTATTVDSLLADSYLPPLKGPLDTVMAQTGNEYRVLPTGALDYGVSTSLFRNTPNVLIAEGANAWNGGTCLNVVKDGIIYSEDIDGYRNSAKAISRDYDLDAGTGSAFSNASDFSSATVYGWHGTQISFCGSIVRADTNDVSDVDALANSAADLYAFPSRDIKARVDHGCVLGRVVPGDWVYISSIENDVFDSTKEVTVDGTILNPEKLRVVAIRQPFTEGMGAYVVRRTGTTWNITRITDYIAPESPIAELEIGTATRASVPYRFESILR